MTGAPPPAPPDPSVPPAIPASPRGADDQLAHEAAIGRAVMMVQRMEEEARERIRLQAEAELVEAQRNADALVAEARQRATEVAEITREAVARVLAEEHAELLDGLAELQAVEQRLRRAVERTHARIGTALDGVVPTAAAPAAPAPTAPESPVPAAPPEGMPMHGAVAPPVPTVATVASPVPEVPLAAGAAEYARGPAGADDAFIAELRDAIDGQSTIAGRGAPVEPSVDLPAVEPVPVPRAPTAPGPFATAAAAAMAATAVAAPVAEPTVAPALRIVPPVPAARVAPVAAPAPAVAPPLPPVPDAPEGSPPGPPTDGPGPLDPTGGSGSDRSSRRARERAKRSRWAKTGTVLRNIGVLLLLFVVFQLWGTAALERRDQSRLRKDFTVALAAQGSAATPLSADGTGGDASTVTTPATAPAAPAAPTGEAVAVIKIPKIGVEQAVVEGTGVSDLRKGPGHYRNTPMPGQPGNAAIAGHRTTYGAPFNRVDELGPGDKILVTTLQGKYTYVVSDAPFAVKPSQNDVLFDKGDNRLTLTTCHPKYSASQRLIVVAKLTKDQKPAPVPKSTKARTTVVKNADASTKGDVGALLPAILWGLAVAAAYAGMVWLSRHWVRRAAFLIGVPVVLALLFPFFEQLSRLLPANY